MNGASDEDIKSLVKTLSAAAAKHKKAEFKAFVIFTRGSDADLKKLNKELKADNIALTTVDGLRADGMRKYNVNPAAKSTVFLYRDRTVKAKIVNYNAKSDAKTLSSKIDLICK